MRFFHKPFPKCCVAIAAFLEEQQTAFIFSSHKAYYNTSCKQEEARQFLCDEIDTLQEQINAKKDDRFDMDTLLSTQMEKRHLESKLNILIFSNLLLNKTIVGVVVKSSPFRLNLATS